MKRLGGRTSVVKSLDFFTRPYFSVTGLFLASVEEYFYLFRNLIESVDFVWLVSNI